jgi:hypothetical protein
MSEEGQVERASRITILVNSIRRNGQRILADGHEGCETISCPPQQPPECQRRTFSERYISPSWWCRRELGVLRTPRLSTAMHSETLFAPRSLLYVLSSLNLSSNDHKGLIFGLINTGFSLCPRQQCLKPMFATTVLFAGDQRGVFS